MKLCTGRRQTVQSDCWSIDVEFRVPTFDQTFFPILMSWLQLFRGYFQFDAPSRRFFGRMASASSTRDSASALRDVGPEIAAGSSVLFIASVIFLALIASAIFLALNVAAGGGSVILAGLLQSRLDISAASSSLSSLCAVGSDTVSAMRRPVKGFSGWSRPMLPNHADFAATEQAQRDISAAPLRRYRRFLRCPDSVSDLLRGQAVVAFNASRSRGAGGTGTGVARGDSGEVRREAHPMSIPKLPVDCGTFHAARTERLFRRLARCCRAGLRLSSAREAKAA